MGNEGGWGPAFGDLDADGQGEVVLCTHNAQHGTQAWTWAYETDGTLMAGFPALTCGDVWCSPTVADLDGDSRAEIIVGEYRYPGGKVYAFSGTGQLLPGWPVNLDHVPVASAGVVDIDGDGVKEVFYESYLSLHAFRLDGSRVAGFPFVLPGGDSFSYAAPAFGDCDGDGLPEIAVGAHNVGLGGGSVYVLDGDGRVLPGWPAHLLYWCYTPPTFVDLDGDGDLEIMAGDGTLAICPSNYAHAWHGDGSYVAGWPVGPIWAVTAQIAVADLDADGDPELIWDTNAEVGEIGYLNGYHHDGTPIAGWPLEFAGTPFPNPVALGDADVDGDIDMLVCTEELNGTSSSFHLVDLTGTGAPSAIQMPMSQYGPGREGAYRGTSAIGIPHVPSVESALMLHVSTNPFMPGGSITFGLPRTGRVSLAIFDSGGRLVRTLLDGHRARMSSACGRDNPRATARLCSCDSVIRRRKRRGSRPEIGNARPSD